MLAKLREICTVLLQEGIKVCLRSPVGIVDDPSAVGALVQGRSDIARVLATFVIISVMGLAIIALY
jgi:hypothetical protein